MNIYNEEVVIQFDTFEEGLKIMELMKKPHAFTEDTIKNCLKTYSVDPCISLHQKGYADKRYWGKLRKTVVHFKELNKPKYRIYI